MAKAILTAVTAAALGVACSSSEPLPAASADRASASLGAESEQGVRRIVLLEAEARVQLCRTAAPVEACWGPSDDGYRAAIEEHLQLLAVRRKVTRELNEATERACAGLSDFDRDVSPFAHRSDIAKVEPLEADGRLAGARVFFRAVSGLSAPKLRRIVDCHIAQAEELDHRVPDETFCPLNPPEVRAVVRDARDGYVIDVTSADPEAAAEVLRRALELTHLDRPLLGGGAHG
jgi:hypothetical protein